MKIEEASGVLELRGNGVAFSGEDMIGATRCSLIQVGDVRINDVLIHDYLENFLVPGRWIAVRCAQIKPSKAAVLVAVQREDGTVERLDERFTKALAGSVICSGLGSSVLGAIFVGPAVAVGAAFWNVGLPLLPICIIGSALLPLILVFLTLNQRGKLMQIRDMRFPGPLDPHKRDTAVQEGASTARV
jgi:hypothetical protein